MRRAALGLLVGLLAPAVGAAGWLPLRTLDEAGLLRCPSVVSTGRTTLAVWSRYPDGLVASWRGPDGTFGPTSPVSDSLSCASLALGASGRAAVVWSDEQGGLYGETHLYGVHVSVLDGAGPPDGPSVPSAHFAAA